MFAAGRADRAEDQERESGFRAELRDAKFGAQLRGHDSQLATKRREVLGDDLRNQVAQGIHLFGDALVDVLHGRFKALEALRGCAGGRSGDLLLDPSCTEPDCTESFADHRRLTPPPDDAVTPPRDGPPRVGAV
jgi:hypothetical protein